MKSKDYIQHAKDIYNLPAWSENYFDINAKGQLVVNLGENNTIALIDIVKHCAQHNLQLPLLLRIDNILEQQLDNFYQAFYAACDKHNFHGHYTAAYPIKVNQNYSVVQALMNTPQHNVGLEAGSKPELLAVIACAKPTTPIICNGFKDEDYLRLALLATKIGLEVNIIIEKAYELDLILKLQRELNIKPRLGVRVRLATVSNSSKWQNTGGLQGKFGLSSSQLVTLLATLKKHNALDLLKVLHFHIGSQISNLDDIKNCVTEALRYYQEIIQQGAPLDTLDLGGGLAVDYDGTQSASYFSKNYSLQQYADTIVKTIASILPQDKHPRIISECGRAMVAYHSVLITNIVDLEQPPTTEDCTYDNQLTQLSHKLSVRNASATWEESGGLMQTMQQQFVNGKIKLPEYANFAQQYLQLLFQLEKTLDPKYQSHAAILNIIAPLLAKKVICNFSIFKSLPDVWGLNQVFPIMPITHLDQPLNMHATIHDLTCDSDGKIPTYVNSPEPSSSLVLPTYEQKQPYLLGFFLLGAYQEILGDIHNLFGAPNTVNIAIEDNKCVIKDNQHSDQMQNILQDVGYSHERISLLLSADSADTPEIALLKQQILEYLEHPIYHCSP